MAHTILIAMDDSPNALRAVQFVANSFSPDNSITLFNVVLDTATLCQLESPELTPLFKSQQASFCALENKKRELVDTAMQKAQKVLMDAGFAADSIKIQVQNKNNGVARDILREAENGYDLIVMGRRGTTGIKEFFLGSISQKVFHLAKDISVLIVN